MPEAHRGGGHALGMPEGPPVPAQPSQQHQSSGQTEASPEAKSGRRRTLFLDTFSMVQSMHFSRTRQYVSPFLSSLRCRVNQDQDRRPSPRQCPFQDLLAPILPWCPPVTPLNPGSTSVQPDLLPGPTITARLQLPPGGDRALRAPGTSKVGSRVGAEQDCPPVRVQDVMKVTMETTQPLETAGAPCPSCLPTSSSCALKPGGLEAHPLPRKVTAAPHPVCWEGCFFVEGDPPKSKIKGSLYTTPHGSTYTGLWGQDSHQALSSLRRSPGSG